MNQDFIFQNESDLFFNQTDLPIAKYKFISVIGKGAFSTVLLVKSKKDAKYYAIKVMKKKRILQTGFTDNILTEKTILSNIDHPFMVKLKESFQDSQKLYLVMDYCPGGELLGLLQSADKLSEQQAKFYAVQVLLVLQKLHEKKIIYRDLKPQNILLDAKGYLKITDFGLSKALYQDQEKALSICGTPEYFTPQMIKRKGHNQTVDWWCFGCLLYEMVVGMPPFLHKNRSILFDKILQEPVYFPPQLSPELKDLLGGLLKKDPHERLGSQGATDVKNHKWFKNVNFSHILNKTIKPPFIPVIHSEEDVSNFSKEFTNTSLSTVEEKYSMVDEDENQSDHFLGFDFGGNSRQELQ